MTSAYLRADGTGSGPAIVQNRSSPGSVMFTVAAVLKLTPSREVSMRYWDAYAASQFNSTVSTVRGLPRSIWSHWLSSELLLQRVAESSSTAMDGPNEPSCELDAEAGRPA